MTMEQSALVRALNDLLRESNVGGSITVTSGVAALGPLFVVRALERVATFNAFDDDNDPFKEHDFGAFELEGRRLFWKIDYYDETLTNGADDPSDPNTCAAFSPSCWRVSTDTIAPSSLTNTRKSHAFRFIQVGSARRASAL